MSGTASAATRGKSEMDKSGLKRDLFCARFLIVRQGIVSMLRAWDSAGGSAPRVWISEATGILGKIKHTMVSPVFTMAFERDSRLTRIESKAFSESSLQSIIIPRTVEILCSGCFLSCESLSSISFESESRLTRIESGAFLFSSLQSIIIPRTVEILCSKCFSRCRSLSSISFERESRLRGSESSSFSWPFLDWMIIPGDV
jgi:hypothetical protein